MTTKTYNLGFGVSPSFVNFSTSDTHKKDNNKVYTYNFTQELSLWDDFYKITKVFAYSNSIFKDGHRKKSNVIGFHNLVIFDIDDHYTARAVVIALQGVKSLIVTTMSHTKEHNRFRIIIPLDKCFNSNISDELYREVLSVICSVICLMDVNKIDKNCMGIDRAFAPNKKQIHFYIRGLITPLEEVLKIAKTNLAKKQKPLNTNSLKFSSDFCSSDIKEKRNYIKKNLTPDFMTSIVEERGLIVLANGQVRVQGKNTNALSIDNKTGLLRDFAKNISYDPVSLLYDVYKEGELVPITNEIYKRMKGA